jgi:hypothetical protein
MKCQLKELDAFEPSAYCRDDECKGCSWFICDKMMTKTRVRVRKFLETYNPELNYAEKVVYGDNDKIAKMIERIKARKANAEKK